MREREPREGNAKSFVEREGHSRDLTVQTAPWPSHAATFTMQHSFIPTHVRSKIYAIAFTPTFRPHLCSRIHDAPFTLHLSSRIHAAVHMLPRSLGSIVSPLSLRSIDAAALTLPHLCRRFYVPARTPPHARRMHATAFTPGAALMLPRSRRCIVSPLTHCSIYAAPPRPSENKTTYNIVTILYIYNDGEQATLNNEQ